MMRLTACALSAVLLSGCSWLGGFGGSSGGHYGFENGPQSAQNGAYSSNQRCQIPSQYHPVPRGCDPASVTIGTAAPQGFPQQPNFSGQNHQSGQYQGGQHQSSQYQNGQYQHYGQNNNQYATQGYGSHAGAVGQQAQYRQPHQKLKKPRWRGSLSLGVEKSVSGSLLDYGKFAVGNPFLGFDPRTFNEGRVEGGTGPNETLTRTTWTGNDQFATDLFDPFDTVLWDKESRPSISFDDAHSTPARLAGGVEYIMSPKATLFANAGYSQSEGESGTVAATEGTLYRYTEIESFDALGASTGVTTSTSFLPNQTFATWDYDFTDMKRYDFELGARYYFDPIIKDQGYRTLTPFVAASGGMSHHNGVSFTVEQNQRYYERAFEQGLDQYFQVPGFLFPGGSNRVDLYDDAWIASGQINAGVEWQMTPKTALAFETGVRIEQARDYSDGTKGDNNVAIPLTIRGSYNF